MTTNGDRIHAVALILETNPLPMAVASDVMNATFGILRHPDAWTLHPLGHTDFQVRSAVVDTEEYANPTMRARQILRALQARLEAWWECRHGMADWAVNYERARLKAGFWRCFAWASRYAWVRWQREKEWQRFAYATMERLSKDLTERIERESRTLVKMMEEIGFEEATKDRDEREKDHWRRMAKLMQFRQQAPMPGR